MSKFDRRAAGLPEDPDWYRKLTFADQPRPRTPVRCPAWVDPAWWKRKFADKPSSFMNEDWADDLCDQFNKIDKRGRHG